MTCTRALLLPMPCQAAHIYKASALPLPVSKRPAQRLSCEQRQHDVRRSHVSLQTPNIAVRLQGMMEGLTGGGDADSEQILPHPQCVPFARFS